MSYAQGVQGTYTGQNLFTVTPQKNMCLWKTSHPDVNLGPYCCPPGTAGRPVNFTYTPDSERWKCCSKFKGCQGKPKLSAQKGNYEKGIC